MNDTNCVFCDIVQKNRSSHVIYEESDVMAFLDINPLSRGHTLVIPRNHSETLSDIPENISMALGRVIVELATEIEDAVEADGSTVGFNNGKAAGQVVPHVHAHIIPRFHGDGGGNLHAVAPNRVRGGNKDLESVANIIRSKTTQSTD